MVWNDDFDSLAKRSIISVRSKTIQYGEYVCAIRSSVPA